MKIEARLLKLAADTVALLAADMVEKAKSGHPGAPMGMSLFATLLFLKRLRYYPADPEWRGRDRFVLSAGHASALLYALLHLAGYELSMEDLKRFRQFRSRCPGHPEFGVTPGVECSTGPLGQGFANAVGMALMELMFAEQFSPRHFGNRVFCVAGDGDLMEGITSEAAALAGHWRLRNLTVLFDSNDITIDGSTKLATSTDIAGYYTALGWDTLTVDGTNPDEVCRALDAVDGREKPLLIIFRTEIGHRAANKAGKSSSHGAPLGEDELRLTKEKLGWDHPPFYVPDEVRELFTARAQELRLEYEGWQRNTAQVDWPAIEAVLTREVPDDFYARLLGAMPHDGKAIATRKLSEAALRAATAILKCIPGGSADLACSNLVTRPGVEEIGPGRFTGWQMHFGVREHGMAAIANGFAYWGMRPFVSTFLSFFQYMLPSIRMAAFARLPVLYVFTHDSYAVGEDGGTHQPVEHIWQLRLTPNIRVFRPSSPAEVAAAYSSAFSHLDGPTVILCSRQNFMPVPDEGVHYDEIMKGAHIVHGCPLGEDPHLVIVGTGAECRLAYDVGRELSGVPVRVISMPCVELFKQQPLEWRRQMIPYTARQVVIEAGCEGGWRGAVHGLQDNQLLISLDHWGDSAPAEVLADEYGFTVPKVLARIREAFQL